jgi:hypothetical protein
MPNTRPAASPSLPPRAHNSCSINLKKNSARLCENPKFQSCKTTRSTRDAVTRYVPTHPVKRRKLSPSDKLL